MSDKRNIELDVNEIQEVKNTGKSIVIQRYVDGELMEFHIQVNA